ncbi:MAG: lytic transglycosylase domain-containing protein [Vampirovibrio sp.]
MPRFNNNIWKLPLFLLLTNCGKAPEISHAGLNAVQRIDCIQGTKITPILESTLSRDTYIKDVIPNRLFKETGREPVNDSPIPLYSQAGLDTDWWIPQDVTPQDWFYNPDKARTKVIPVKLVQGQDDYEKVERAAQDYCDKSQSGKANITSTSQPKDTNMTKRATQHTDSLIEAIKKREKDPVCWFEPIQGYRQQSLDFSQFPQDSQFGIQKYKEPIDRIARENDVNPAWAHALIQQESRHHQL